MQSWVRVKNGQKDPLPHAWEWFPLSAFEIFLEICSNETGTLDLLLYQISALILDSFMVR